jgi:hypothetical protein
MKPFLEALCLQAARKRLLDHEDDPVSAAAQNLADAGAVVRRAVGALREEHDRRHSARVSHGRLLLVKARRSVASVFFDDLADH